MRKVNTNDVEELAWESPRGKFRGTGRQISEALGRIPQSRNVDERHPFDIEIARIPAGATPFPYHAHSAQWEFYHVISGTGTVRDAEGVTHVGPGDAFLFKPGEAHTMTADAEHDLVLYVVADNPFGEHHYFPDSDKWSVNLGERKLVRSKPLDYFDGEE